MNNLAKALGTHGKVFPKPESWDQYQSMGCCQEVPEMTARYTEMEPEAALAIWGPHARIGGPPFPFSPP